MEPAGKGGEAAWLTKGLQDSKDDSAEDCPVCLTAFDDTVQRPRTLPCGHTLCTPCINKIKEQGQVLCPKCRIKHVVPEKGFGVSYVIEDLIRRLKGAVSPSPPPRVSKDTEEPASSSVTGPGPAELSATIRSMLQEQKDKVLVAIGTCQEVQEHLDQYQATLSAWGERQQNLEDRLQALVDNSKSARVLLRQEEFQVAAKKKQVQQGEQQLHALLQSLHTVTTGLEVYKAIDDVDHRTNEGKQMAEECREMFPNVNTVITINKIMEASSAALEAATAIQAAQETADTPAGAAGDHDLTAAPDSSITDRVEVLLAPTLKAEDLRSLTQPARSLLQAGLVFAVHQQEGRRRHGRISHEDGRLYLHALQDQPPPHRAVTVQMDEVVPAAPPCLVFLDLEWPGSSLRRILIRLTPDTPRGRQFVMLCTGQRGPCYVNTRLWEVWNKKLPGECVSGGDHENNNGTGGAALLPSLDKGEYRRSRQAGDVWGWGNDAALGAQFCITTRDCQLSGELGVFGDVVGGLDGVAAAAQHSPIKEVTVVDCGVVLWA